MNIKRPRILRFIAHIVDSATNGLLQSEVETDIGPKSGFPHDFFKGYITHALNDEMQRFALFAEDGGKEVVKKAFADFRSGAVSFVEASRTIATHLDVVVNSSRYSKLIKRGDLMVALVEDEASGSTAEPCLALLKINPSRAIVRHSKRIDGKRTVVFESDDRVPAPNEDEVQKIALISPRRLTDPEPHDLVILDYNLRRTDIAHFFFDDFLHTRLNRDPSETADGFRDRMREFPDVFSAGLEPPLSATEKLVFAEKADEALGETEVSPAKAAEKAVEAWKASRTVAVVEDARRQLATYLARLPAEKVDEEEPLVINPERVKRRSQKLTYLLDDNVKISGSAAAVKKLVQIAENPDAQGRTVLTIRSGVFKIL